MGADKVSACVSIISRGIVDASDRGASSTIEPRGRSSGTTTCHIDEEEGGDCRRGGDCRIPARSLHVADWTKQRPGSSRTAVSATTSAEERNAGYSPHISQHEQRPDLISGDVVQDGTTGNLVKVCAVEIAERLSIARTGFNTAGVAKAVRFHPHDKCNASQPIPWSTCVRATTSIAERLRRRRRN